MTIQDFEAMYVADMYRAREDAKALVAALPKLAEAAADPELAAAFKAHLVETSQQIDRIDQVAEDHVAPAAPSDADAIEALIAQAIRVAGSMAPGALRDTAIIAAAQRIQHFRIATYGTLAAYAKLLDLHDEKRILGAILEEERAIDEDLTVIATELIEADRPVVAA
jgi:ferritin-like metal-binding protein YciE